MTVADILHHAAHAVVVAVATGGGFLLLGDVGDERLGGE
jgi:hypothetical protein